MDFIASLLGSMIAMWVITRIVYYFTAKKLKRKQQAGLGFVIGILFIIILTSSGWFEIDASITYLIALFLWFILDITEVTNRKKNSV